LREVHAHQRILKFEVFIIFDYFLHFFCVWGGGGGRHERKKNGRLSFSTGLSHELVLKVTLLHWFMAQTGAKGWPLARNPFSTGSWLKSMLKIPYEPVLIPCGFPATSWPYEPMLMHPLIWVRSTTGAKAPDNSKRKQFFILPLCWIIGQLRTLRQTLTFNFSQKI
jgi:hypothetical protein